VHKTKLYQWLVIASGLGAAVASTPTLAKKDLPSISLNWTAGTAVVDGDISEWGDLTSTPFNRMCEAGQLNLDGTCNNKDHLSTLYSRYDCDTDTMYLLVLKEDGHTADGERWVKIYDLDNSEHDIDIADVVIDGVSQGYEASFALAGGTFYESVEVHINIDGGRTSSTGKINSDISINVPVDCDMPDDDPPTPDLGSCDYIYGVHDGGKNNTQLLRYSVEGGIEEFGSPLPGYDIEALDISLDGILYGASGDDTNNQGFLYTFDMLTGELLTGDPTGCTEIDGISFNPIDGSLWGWDQVQGLIQIVGGECLSVLPNPGGFEIEDLSWDNAGQVIYFTYNQHSSSDLESGDASSTYHIGKYNLSGSVDWDFCSMNVPEIEAIEVLNDGTLLLGYNNNGQQFTLVNPNTCALESTSGAGSSYDIEGLTVCPPIPE
jgi:hypothetical protein